MFHGQCIVVQALYKNYIWTNFFNKKTNKKKRIGETLNLQKSADSITDTMNDPISDFFFCLLAHFDTFFSSLKKTFGSFGHFFSLIISGTCWYYFACFCPFVTFWNPLIPWVGKGLKIKRIGLGLQIYTQTLRLLYWIGPIHWNSWSCYWYCTLRRSIWFKTSQILKCFLHFIPCDLIPFVWLSDLSLASLTCHLDASDCQTI